MHSFHSSAINHYWLILLNCSSLQSNSRLPQSHPAPLATTDRPISPTLVRRIGVVPDRVFKIVFCGDLGVGKTSYIWRLCNESAEFSQGSMAPTIGENLCAKQREKRRIYCSQSCRPRAFCHGFCQVLVMMTFLAWWEALMAGFCFCFMVKKREIVKSWDWCLLILYRSVRALLVIRNYWHHKEESTIITSSLSQQPFGKLKVSVLLCSKALISRWRCWRLMVTWLSCRCGTQQGRRGESCAVEIHLTGLYWESVLLTKFCSSWAGIEICTQTQTSTRPQTHTVSHMFQHKVTDSGLRSSYWNSLYSSKLPGWPFHRQQKHH